MAVDYMSSSPSEIFRLGSGRNGSQVDLLSRRDIDSIVSSILVLGSRHMCFLPEKEKGW